MKRASSLHFCHQTTHSACPLALPPVCLSFFYLHVCLSNCLSGSLSVCQPIVYSVCNMSAPDLRSPQPLSLWSSLQVVRSELSRWVVVWRCACAFLLLFIVWGVVVGVTWALDRANVNCELVKAEIEPLDWSIIILGTHHFLFPPSASLLHLLRGPLHL